MDQSSIAKEMIQPQDIYLPLYEDTDHFIILITGGRGSGKSFNAGTFIERLSFEAGHVILYCRYTMASAAISVIPEFTEKIEAMVRENFSISQKQILKTSYLEVEFYSEVSKHHQVIRRQS